LKENEEGPINQYRMQTKIWKPIKADHLVVLSATYLVDLTLKEWDWHLENVKLIQV
jgi:hypothetical protein